MGNKIKRSSEMTVTEFSEAFRLLRPARCELCNAKSRRVYDKYLYCINHYEEQRLKT